MVKLDFKDCSPLVSRNLISIFYKIYSLFQPANGQSKQDPESGKEKRQRPTTDEKFAAKGEKGEKTEPLR